MYNIKLEVTENGCVKIVTDDNADGNKELLKTRKGYIIDDDQSVYEFLRDICHDLGISSFYVGKFLKDFDDEVSKKVLSQLKLLDFPTSTPKDDTKEPSKKEEEVKDVPEKKKKGFKAWLKSFFS